MTYILDGTKISYHKDRVDAWLAGERIPPITMDVAFSTRCPYRCQFCYSDLQTNTAVTLPRDTVLRLVDDAAEIGVRGMVFQSDGESTCASYFYEAAKRAKANGLDLGLATNGYLLKEEELEELLPLFEYIRFNLPAADPGRFSEIAGVSRKCYYKEVETIRQCVAIKQRLNLPVTLNTSLVLMPQYADQVMPLARLSKELGVDYFIIKHCSDDENGVLRHKYGFGYENYRGLTPLLQQAEAQTTDDFLVSVKPTKIESEGRRCYTRCYGCQFLLQASGNGLLAPCGKLFPEKFRDYHIGYLQEQGLKEMWQGERYWEVMGKLADGTLNPQTDCGLLCAQEDINTLLWQIKDEGFEITEPNGKIPQHLNFI